MREIRTQLRRHGVGFIDIKQMKKLPHEPAWAARLTADPAAVPLFQEELRELVAGECERVESASGRSVEQVLISNERMVGARMPSQVDYPVFRPLVEASITEVIEALDPGEVHVALYTRRQDRLIESCYLWEVQKGRSHGIREQFPFMDEPVIRYSALAARIAAIPRVGSVRVRPFEIIGAGAVAYLDDFLTNVGLQGAVDLSGLEPDLSANQSYSHPALQIALALNGRLETREERAGLRRILKTHLPASSHPAAVVLTGAERRHLLEIYRDENEHLFSTWMPDLPRDAYSTEAKTKELAATLSGENRVER